jgi:pimeloyl-ACP methyl ester carboxylesterase
MLGFLMVLALQLASPDPGANHPVISPAEFRASFDAASAGRLSIPVEAAREAGRYRYVFVGGFHNEGFPGYFTQNAKELRANGVPKKAIHFIYPSSRETVDGNAEAVRTEFEEIASQGPEKLVVIAHSRGSCDVLAFALQNPDFVALHFHSLFLIQGPFGGTPIADYVVGEGPAMDNRMPLGHRIVAHVLANAEGYLLNHGKHGGLTALTRSASEEFWQDLLKESSAAISIVGPKTFYVTSQIPPSGRRLFQRAAASYLETYFGPNDGVVALADQTVPGLGTVLAVLDAGHTDLTNRFPSARAAHRMRKALIDAIIMAVGEQKATAPSKRDADTEASSSNKPNTRKGQPVRAGRRS